MCVVIKARRRSDGEREVHVRRALRGVGSCPGFVEDWELAGAIAREDVPGLIERVLATAEVSLAVLCDPCRHYVGPEEMLA